MNVTGISFERAYHTRMDELRREAYVAAQVRQATRRPLVRLAAGLRKLAARLDRPGRVASGPWREDFEPAASWHA
ncbi:MAG TPA: hypothetical protein VKA00_09140 [Trueperaceae bacterium]|nr:hypothetical protein [Trueperaceae bacterium]